MLPARLTPLEYAALAAIVVIWGVNNAFAKIATETMPPLMVGALRFALAAVCLVPFVRPPFPNPKTLIALVLLGGPIHFGLVYIGFAWAQDLSPLAVSLQLWIPFVAVFSWLVLKETLTPAVIGGLVLAFAGIVWMTADPHALEDWDAIAIGAVASAAWALATVFARRASSVSPAKLQGLLSLGTAPTLFAASALLEGDPRASLAASAPEAYAAVAFGALVSTVFATGLLFWLVQRREAGRVTPYLLTTPIVSVAIGWAFMGDVLTAQILAGAAVTILGVGVVSLAERRMKARTVVEAEATTA